MCKASCGSILLTIADSRGNAASRVGRDGELAEQFQRAVEIGARGSGRSAARSSTTSIAITLAFVGDSGVLARANKLRSGAFTRSKIVSATTGSGCCRVPFGPGGEAVRLALDALPSEEPSVDRPTTRSQHRQSASHGSGQQAHQWVAVNRQDLRDLDQRQRPFRPAASTARRREAVPIPPATAR